MESVILDNQQVDDPKNIIIQDSGNHIMKVNYQPTTENSVLQDVHFYDYTMIPNDGSPGINDLSNYEAGAQFDHIEGKRDKTKVYGNVFTVGLTTSQGDPLKAASRFSGFYDSNGKPVFMNQGSAMVTQGIVKSLSGENYSQVNFRDGIYAPKLFNNDPSLHVNGMTNIDNYKLRFERHGDTYTLKEALKPDGSHAGNVDIKTKQPTEAYTGDSNFYPLDDYSDEIPDSKINLSTTYSKQLADGSREYHNMLFGMRFDVKFSVDQYSDLSQLRFNFSGDDDMWAFIDGKLALDVGGNHGELTDSFNIGDLIDKNDAGKEHQLTVLYMERGGNLSNCAISFTLPSTNKRKIEGTKVNFDKYLVMEKNANVPNATFNFTLSTPTDDEMQSVANPTNTQLTLRKGIGTPTASATTFAPGDETYDSVQKTNTPDLQDDQVEGLTATKKYAKKTSTVDFSNVTFSEPGVYRYKETENATTEKGVTTDTDPRYLDVYVSYDENGVLGIWNSKLLKANDSTSNENKGFTNTYITSDLTLTKTVTGNQGFRDQYFKFTVTVSNLDANARLFVTDNNGNKVYKSTDTVAYSYNADNGKRTDGQKRFVATAGSFEDITTGTSDDMKGLALNANDQGLATFDVYLKNGETVKLNGLTADAKYTITETSEDYNAPAKKDNNALTLTHNDQNHTDAIAEQTLTDNDEITFINNREGVVPVGVFNNNHHVYLTMSAAVLALGAIIAGMRCRKVNEARREENSRK